MAEKKMEKTLEAKTATLLKYMLDMELQRIKDRVGGDMVFFVGVDGRIFASTLPEDMSHAQFYMFNLIRDMLPSICSQLRNENLQFSFQHYPEGTIFISGVGKNAFLAVVRTAETEPEKIPLYINELIKAGKVLLHIFEQKPMDPTYLEKLEPEVGEELKTLARQLFVEQFEQTRGYRKNMKILEWIKKKLEETLGVGAVEEVITMTFNELGTSAPYMTDKLWPIFLEKIIQGPIREARGDIVADECYKTWMPELELKLKSFV